MLKFHVNILYHGGLKLTKSNLLKILKLSIGCSFAIFIAYIFNLEYYTVAGVITLLTVKNTKKETLKGTLGKIYGFMLCTVFSYICFNYLGYNLCSFSIYIIIIISLCFLLNIQDVIAMCVVLSSHYYLQGSISIYWIFNECGLFIIGAGIGVIINMYIPSNINKIYDRQIKLQEEVSSILIKIADLIVNPNDKYNCNDDLSYLNILIRKGISDAYDNMNNNLLSDTKFFLDHMEIIKSQSLILENLYTYVSQLSDIPLQGYIISAFIHKIGHSSFEIETVNSLLNELDRIFDNIKNQPLPVDRDEFENRAILFLCLTEIRKLLINRKNAQILRDNNYYNI